MKRILISLLSVALFVPGLLSHAADNPAPRQENREFAKEHPRRAEVNQRIERQKRELKRQLKSGKITQAQYDAQMAQLKNIKQEERSDVKANDGRLTKGEQKNLNQQLNTTHQEIKSDNGAPANQPPATTPPPPPAQ